MQSHVLDKQPLLVNYIYIFYGDRLFLCFTVAILRVSLILWKWLGLMIRKISNKEEKEHLLSFYDVSASSHSNNLCSASIYRRFEY